MRGWAKKIKKKTKTKNSKTKHKKILMDPFVIVLLVFFVLALLFVLILVIVKVTTQKLYYVDMVPTMNELYVFGDVNDNIQYGNNAKPFSVQSTTQIRQSRLAYVFNDVDSYETKFTDSRIVGFQFQFLDDENIIALQFINQLNTSNQSHSFAIYDAVTMVEITDPNDNVVNPVIDPVDDYGFVTHTLATPVLVLANHPYIIVATVSAQDSYLDSADEKTNIDAVTQKSSVITITNPAFTPGATSLAFPTTFTGLEQYFVSFSFRPVPVLAPVFDVDMTTGGAPRYPPRYISGFNITVINGQSSNVMIDPGVACAFDNAANISLSRPVVLSTQVGRNGLDEGVFQVGQFYYVYVCGSASQGLPTCGILSLDRIEPQLPIGYDSFRRVGTVRSSGSVFEPCVQEGSGVSRTTYYTSGLSNFQIAAISGPTNLQLVPLLLVPPTASRAQIIVKAFSTGLASHDVPQTTNGLVQFFPDATNTTTGQTISYQDQQQSQSAETVVFLNPKILPISMYVSIFGFGPSGYIPDGSRSSEVLISYFYLGAYFETL